MSRITTAFVIAATVVVMGLPAIAFYPPAARSRQRSRPPVRARVGGPKRPSVVWAPKTKSPELPNFQGIREMAVGDSTPVFPVEVDADLSLDAATQALYQQMADNLSGYATVPNDRLNYFSAVNAPPRWQINFWEAIVEEVSPNNGGYLVKVRVVPDLTSDDYGPATIISSEYFERYQVTNGVIQYVGFDDPDGLAGSFPDQVFGL